MDQLCTNVEKPPFGIAHSRRTAGGLPGLWKALEIHRNDSRKVLIRLLKGASVVGVFWGEFVRREPQAQLAAMRQMLGWIAEGKLKPLVSARYALEETPQALKDMAARKVTGKVIIIP